MLNMPAHSHSNKSLPNLLDWIKTTITVNYFTPFLVVNMLLRDDQTCTTSTTAMSQCLMIIIFVKVRGQDWKSLSTKAL